MTDAERILWYALRARRFADFKFRRQVPFDPYVADFCCFEAKLIIEVDGGQHGDDDARRRDAIRTARLSRDGFRVLRFWNREVTNWREREGTMMTIASALGID